jgi:fibronectin type 3 domain-containing protein
LAHCKVNEREQEFKGDDHRIQTIVKEGEIEMKKLLLLAAIFALVFTSCEQPTDETHSGSKLPSLTIRNESSYILTDVKFSGISFASSGNDLPISSQSVKQLTANDLNKAGYITFTRKDIGIACRTEAIAIGNEDYTFTFLDTSVVEEIANLSNKKSLAQITFISKVTVELGGLAVPRNDIVDIEGFVNLIKQTEFTLKNTSGGKLLLTGTQPVKITGTGADAFSVVQPANSEIAPNGSLTFKINFNPGAVQVYNATVTVSSNDQDGDFTFTIRGTSHIPVPQITVTQDTDPVNPFGEYDFGNVELGRTSDVTFTIGNSGGANLTFVTVDGNRINLADNSSNVFSVVQQPSAATAVIPGGTTTFIIRFSPNLAESVFTATVKIKTNSNENEDFSFTVQGGSYEVAPAAPIGVTATAQSISSIRVSWNPVPGATSYKVYYGTNSSSITILASSTVTGTSYTHIGLEANTTYYYRVIAVNGAGDSDSSSSVSAKTQINAPTGVSATAQSASSIRVSWNPLSGATSYKVYYATGSASGTKILASTVTTTSYTHTGLQAGTTYYYFVVAVSGNDESDYSSYSSAVVLPAVPSGVSATTQSTSSIRVSWNPVTGATSYKVYYATGSSSGNKILAGTATTTSYTHNSLQGSTTYYYFIVAVNNSGESDYSTSSSATTQIAAPAGVAAAGQSTSSIRVSWNSVTGATSYRIYYSDTQTGAKILLTSVTGTSYTHTGLQAGQSYYYFITAINSSGTESEYSSYAYGYANFT